jgi:hypothetical protein
MDSPMFGVRPAESEGADLGPLAPPTSEGSLGGRALLSGFFKAPTSPARSEELHLDEWSFSLPAEHPVTHRYNGGERMTDMLVPAGLGFGESMGTAKLYINDKQVATGAMTAQVGKFTLVGDGLCVGFDSGDPVSKQYSSPGEFEGGEISFVTVNTGKEKYLDLEREAARAFSKE